MTKADLLQEIEDKKQEYSSAIGIAYILGSGAWKETFEGYRGIGNMTINSGLNNNVFVVDPKSILDRYESPEAIQNDSVNIIRLAGGELLRNSFERIQEYCEITNQRQTFTSLSWYHFARIIRNSFSHDFNFNFKKRDGTFHPNQSLQFSDRIITLDQAAHGTEIDLDSFPFPYLSELIEMMKLSVINNLQ